jgi:hypothetical protein
MAAIEDSLLYSQIQRGESTPCYRATWEAPGCVRRLGEWGLPLVVRGYLVDLALGLLVLPVCGLRRQWLRRSQVLTSLKQKTGQ